MVDDNRHAILNLHTRAVGLKALAFLKMRRQLSLFFLSR